MWDIGYTGFHRLIVHQVDTAPVIGSVNVKVARSKTAWYGGPYWLAGVTQTVVPSAGNCFGSGFHGLVDMLVLEGFHFFFAAGLGAAGVSAAGSSSCCGAGAFRIALHCGQRQP